MSGPCPHLSHSGSRRNPLGRRTGRPRHHSCTVLRAGRGWSRRHPPLENTQRVGPSGKGVSGGGRRGQREEGKGRRGRAGGGSLSHPWWVPSSTFTPRILPARESVQQGQMAAPSALLSEWPRVWAFRKQFCLGVWGISSVGEGLGTQGIHPSIAPTCLAVDSSEACGALAHKGSWEVPTGASISAGLRLALICLCKDRTRGCMSLPTPHGPNGPIGPHMVLYGLTWTYMTSRVLCSA